MKDPAFLFYPNDWLGGTMGMTFEEKGAYIDLLMTQFNRGHMTEHMIGQIVGQLWVNIKDKFTKDENGLWFNIRLEDEKLKRIKYTESRRNNKKGNNQYTYKKPNKELGHMTKHMENENENEDIFKNKKENQLLIFEEFRKIYPGTKRGNKTEFDNLKKKHNDWETILPTLLPKLELQIKSKEYLKSKNEFVPQWKNLSTWINQRCWEEETNVISVNTLTPMRMVHYKMYGQFYTHAEKAYLENLKLEGSENIEFLNYVD